MLALGRYATAASVLELVWPNVVAKRVDLAAAVACAIELADLLPPWTMFVRGSNATN